MGYVSLSVVCGEEGGGEMRIVYQTTEQGKSFLSNFVNVQQGLERLSARSRALARTLT
jgi:DNA-binding PadR family transcriptional regulator